MNPLKLLGLIFYMILFCTTIQAQTEEIIRFQCKVFGLSTEDSKYKTIIEAEFGLEKETITKLKEKPVVVDTIKKILDKGSSDEEIQKQLAYVPVSIDSDFFGSEKGTHLKLTVGLSLQLSQDGDIINVPESSFIAFQYITLNGVTIVSQIKNGYGRVLFNPSGPSYLTFDTDGNHTPKPLKSLNPLSPIITPEGEFHFIYSDCWEDKE